MLDRPGIAEWSFGLPAGWFLVPLEPGEDGRRWALSVVDEAARASISPGARGTIVDELERIQTSLAVRGGGLLQAAVSIQTAVVMSVGCVLTAHQLELDAGDGPDAFSEMLREGMEHPGTGFATLEFEIWQQQIDAGELIGATQRLEQRELGDDRGRIMDRAVYGVFPPGCSEAITLDFVAENLVDFFDIRAETTELVSRVSVVLEAAA